ncbi:hypothetical protein SAY87_010652 [Trapa incisa]|uniref:Uncharacterized protein n=1 Tax=Trapa incisa TaxID=236973 RepID=A0AAN7JIC1_9MYRT|nr:hypothetical protein SAY87_010652 [Trapa incisa]
MVPLHKSLSVGKAHGTEFILMKNKKLQHEDGAGAEHQGEGFRQPEIEVLKAVAQAWCGHSGSSRSSATSEFDAHRLNFRSRPSRFRLEAVIRNKSLWQSMGVINNRKPASCNYWDFGRSLLDSFEILAVSKRLESGMVSEDPFSGDPPCWVSRRRRESKNSLRNLFKLKLT